MYQVVVFDKLGNKFGKVFKKDCPVYKAINYTVDCDECRNALSYRNIERVEVWN